MSSRSICSMLATLVATAACACLAACQLPEGSSRADGTIDAKSVGQWKYSHKRLGNVELCSMNTLSTDGVIVFTEIVRFEPGHIAYQTLHVTNTDWNLNPGQFATVSFGYRSRSAKRWNISAQAATNHTVETDLGPTQPILAQFEKDAPSIVSIEATVQPGRPHQLSLNGLNQASDLLTGCVHEAIQSRSPSFYTQSEKPQSGATGSGATLALNGSAGSATISPPHAWPKQVNWLTFLLPADNGSPFCSTSNDGPAGTITSFTMSPTATHIYGSFPGTSAPPKTIDIYVDGDLVYSAAAATPINNKGGTIIQGDLPGATYSQVIAPRLVNARQLRLRMGEKILTFNAVGFGNAFEQSKECAIAVQRLVAR